MSKGSREMNDDMTTEDLGYVADRDEAQALRKALPYIEKMMARKKPAVRHSRQHYLDFRALNHTRALILRRLEVL